MSTYPSHHMSLVTDSTLPKCNDEDPDSHSFPSIVLDLGHSDTPLPTTLENTSLRERLRNPSFHLFFARAKGKRLDDYDTQPWMTFGHTLHRTTTPSEFNRESLNLVPLVVIAKVEGLFLSTFLVVIRHTFGIL